MKASADDNVVEIRLTDRNATTANIAKTVHRHLKARNLTRIEVHYPRNLAYPLELRTSAKGLLPIWSAPVNVAHPSPSANTKTSWTTSLASIGFA